MKLINTIIKFFKVILPDPNPYVPKKECAHSMIIERYIGVNSMDYLYGGGHSREICTKCKWVNYDSQWTWHENSNKIIL